ncbi:hypothetical protein D9M71_563700 [compost metagenome]
MRVNSPSPAGSVNRLMCRKLENISPTPLTVFFTMKPVGPTTSTARAQNSAPQQTMLASRCMPPSRPI